jgi:predicted Rossmann fold nucleotide-binding protein DprA/Smf involved in DNA uptake
MTNVHYLPVSYPCGMTKDEWEVLTNRPERRRRSEFTADERQQVEADMARWSPAYVSEVGKRLDMDTGRVSAILLVMEQEGKASRKLVGRYHWLWSTREKDLK